MTSLLPISLDPKGQLDGRILSVSPNLAIEWGYNLYIAQVLPDGSETRKSALKAIAEMEATVATFPEGSRERLYLTSLRMAANSFALGVERRKRSRSDSLDTAMQEKEEAIKRCTRDTRRGGLLAAGFKLLLLGGLIFCAVRMVYNMPSVTAQTQGAEANTLSMCSALGLALIGAYVKAWFTDRKMVRLFKVYDKKVKDANEKYAEEVVFEYRLAAQTAETAWRGLTDVPAPMTRAFESLLLGVIKGYCPEDDGTKQLNRDA